MNLVDSSAWLEYLADGPGATEFAQAIEDTDALVVPTIVLYEVTKRITQLKDESAALAAAGAMTRGQVVDLTATLALEAARVSLLENLPLADSVILATARQQAAVLWTQDAHFRGLEGVQYRPAAGSGR